jgi:glycosyltransferase involved in cell wall biosynthesis
MMKVLFVLKKSGYGCNYNYGTSGLLNSSKFIVDMLNKNSVDAKLVVVNDNNSIDREVFNFRPDTVVIEALWVVPEKFDVLKNLHPNVKWVVRIHSDLPFLASDSIAMSWTFEYLKRGVFVAFNDKRTFESIKDISSEDGVLYLPNFYPVESRHRKESFELNIGCFGAIRPLKNQLIQAVAAIQYADSVNRQLNFYVNGTRCEDGGERVLKNLRALFENTGHNLIEITWLDRDEFLEIMSKMSLAMCVSFTETFCIVAADAVTVGTPLICSSQVPWTVKSSVVSTTNVDEIAKRIGELIGSETNAEDNRMHLRGYSRHSEEIWLNTL